MKASNPANETAKNAGFTGGIVSCEPSVYCSGNYATSNSTFPACRQIVLATPDQVRRAAEAAAILQSSWPASTDLEFEGATGSRASLPGAYVRFACDSTTGEMSASAPSVIGCSYVSPGSGWVAGPFFYRNSFPPPGGSPPGGTFTAFDMSGPPSGASGAGACGKLTYATEPVQCTYGNSGRGAGGA